MAKRQPGRRKRASKSDSVSRAKKDANNFAKSIGGFIPGLGTLLGIESVYRDGKKLMASGPKALKSMFTIRIGTKRPRRRSPKRSRR
jgi:hypothetical protein